jgi:hypothetical protein
MSGFLDLIHDPKCKPKFEALLRLAASRGDVDLVIERLSWGIDPNCQTKGGRTPLIVNAMSASPASGVIKALLKSGADPAHMDYKGLTALDYFNRKLAILNLRPRKPPRKSPSLDENDQLILSKHEQKMFARVRREHPDWAKEFITDYIKERIRAAKRVFNDPAQIEMSIDLLEAALKKKR